MSENAGPDWAGARAAYCAGDGSVSQIVARFGVTRRTLYKRIREENWPRRSKWTPARQEPLGERLRVVVERQLALLEQRLVASAPAGGGDAAQRERDARTVSALVRIYEKLLALQGPDEGGPAARDTDRIDHGFRDIDERRNALAQRLADLSEQDAS